MIRHNSTIRIKERPCSSCGKMSPIFSRGRCQQCAKIEDFHTRLARDIKEEEGLPELIDRLDGLVSKFVRLSAADKDKNVECYTCGDKRMWMLMDAGHYVTRACLYLRFDVERNLRPQCPNCNRSKYGMAHVFGKKLELEMPGVTEVLLEESRIIHKWSREELKQMILEYDNKLKTLK